jgi:hypothetical protein
MGGEIFKCFERVCHSVSKEEWRMPLALGTRPNIHPTSIIFEDQLAIHGFTLRFNRRAMLVSDFSAVYSSVVPFHLLTRFALRSASGNRDKSGIEASNAR